MSEVILKFSSQESQNCKDQKEKYPINSLVVFAFDAMKKERIRFFRSAFLFPSVKKSCFGCQAKNEKKKKRAKTIIDSTTDLPVVPQKLIFRSVLGY